MPLSADVLAPLRRQCLFRSDERVEAHDQVSRELIEHALRWRQGAPDAAMYKGSVSRTTLYLLHYGAAVDVSPRPFDGFTLVHTSLTGGAEVEVDGERLDITQGRSAVLAPRHSVRLRWFPGTRQLIVKVPNALLQPPDDAAGGAAEPLAPGFLIAPGQQTQWDLISQSLLNAIASRDVAGFDDGWLEHFERNAALFLLAHRPGVPAALRAPPGGGADVAERPAADGGRRRIDAVVDYTDARLAAPIALEDLARAAGVSVRALNELCHRHFGITPMQLLRQRRLDAARQSLRMRPDASVTEVAIGVGFGHLGRFARYYQERFHELPKRTQASARG